jgi:hypothetical protein
MILKQSELIAIGEFLGGLFWHKELGILTGIDSRTWARMANGKHEITDFVAKILTFLVADRFKDISDGGTLKNQGWSDEFHAMVMGEM